MKKRLLIAALAAATIFTVSCGATGNENNDSNTLTTASQQGQDAPGADEKDSSGFTVLPANAEQALDVASEGAQKAYPLAEGSRSYGYKGRSKVNGVDCYCFSVFDVKDETSLVVGSVAVTADFSKVFAADKGKKDYKEVDLNANTSKLWCETKTPVFVK